MAEAFADIDHSVVPPRVTFPRLYNAAVDLVDRHLIAGRGDRPAYRDDRESVTYAELAARVDRAGHALQALGVKMEQRVLLVMLDSIDFVAVFLGAMKIGAIPVPVNTMLTAADYAHMGHDCRAPVAVVSESLLGKVGPALPEARIVVAPDALAALLDAACSAPLPAAPTTSDDVAFWLYSSGTTGASKAAMHLHRHLMLTAALYAQPVLGIRPDDVVFSAAKLFFAYGLGNALTFPLSVGAEAVLMSERSTPAAITRTLHTHQPTIFCGVPTLFAALLADRGFGPASASTRLRASTSAGEALPAHVGDAWRARFGSDILDGLGSTEMLHIFLSNHPGEVRYGTTGKPVPGYQLKLIGDDGESSPDEGALWVSGPTACIGYFNQRERSLSTFHGPWTRTGDRYTRDAQGYYTYAGRTDDMLKVGGIWVSPFEVESALAGHEAVLEAAVIGHPDDDGLIKPRAFVVLHDAARAGDELAAELKAHVKSLLAPYKYPRVIEFVRELPKTATGKIQRFKLRG